MKSRQTPTGPVLDYPLCTVWSCDDDYDWEAIGPTNPDYAAVKREHDIVYHHEPRDDWSRRLQAERDRLSGGDPLWWGKPEVRP